MGERAYKFVDPIDRVHIDEKWFYLMENGTVVRIFPNEDGETSSEEEDEEESGSEGE